MNGWKPIDTYDRLTKKPRFAIFYVEPLTGGMTGLSLAPLIVTERRYGSCVITHWMPIDPPTEDLREESRENAIAELSEIHQELGKELGEF